MGGAAAGEIASSLAVQEFVSCLKNRLPDSELLQAAEAAILASNEIIFTRAQQNSKLSGMGTTMVAMVTEENRAWVFNVGDSRGYRLRSGKLEQITIDHSLVDEQVRAGRMNAAEAARSPLRNVITRALGTQKSVAPDIFPLDIEPGDLFLLCSDGLTRELSDDLLASMLANDLPVGELCERLVSAANSAGGHDNITCLLLRAQV
jgi:protein phosphatase